MDRSSRKITKASLDEIKINIPLDGNKILEEVVNRINSNDEIKALWKIMNVNAIDRLGMSDHGFTHFQIVSNYGLKLVRMLEEKGIETSIVKDLGLTSDHAEVVVFLACIMHDLGISIHRIGHEEYSLFIARDMLKSVLDFLPIEEKMVVLSETLHAIISHRANGKPLTIEAGIVRIADALDMGKGRARISYKRGEINIYSVSDMAINRLEIIKGNERPIEVKIVIDNPAGIFQVDDLMQEKVKGSHLEKYIEIAVYTNESGQDKLYKEYKF
ncbi:MAG: HD domain-containing protein [Patescibacteria group bacterium]